MSLDNLLEENKPLAPFTTLGIGGPARWFLEVTSEDAIVEATAWAQQRRVNLFVLGGGSNLVVSDAGFDGLVLHVALRGITVADAGQESSQRVYRVAAGEDWDQFVQRSIDDNCAGIECLAGIPGTVGGTPVQNVGAYGQEVSSTIDRVRAFDLTQHKFAEFTTAECGFAYRKSRFNTVDRGRYLVTRVDYRLTLGGKPSVSYGDLKKALLGNDSPSLRQVADTVRHIRQSKGMLLVDCDPDCRSAGSFFKNPVVEKSRAAQIAAICGSEPPRFPPGAGIENAGKVKIPAAWLIEHAGFAKGYALGAVGISSRHTLALVNRGGATAREIVTLADAIRQAVWQRFEIELEMEPVLLGFDTAQPATLRGDYSELDSSRLKIR
jgi:UDP-N-acetylmuramate dehydrogenase